MVSRVCKSGAGGDVVSVVITSVILAVAAAFCLIAYLERNGDDDDLTPAV